MNKSIISFAVSLTLLLFVMAPAHAQKSRYGYKGKRFLINYDLSGSLKLTGFDENGDFKFPRFNIFNAFSFSYVTNKTTAIGMNYRFSSDIASITAEGSSFAMMNSWDGSEYLTHQRFYTNEVGAHIDWFNTDLNAPLGHYFGLGLGLAVSNFPGSFTISGQDPDQLRNLDFTSSSFPDPEDVLFVYDNSVPILSPIIRVRVGTQQLFFERLFINAGVEFGFNVGHVQGLLYDSPSLSEVFEAGTSADIEKQLEDQTRQGVQTRVFYKNLMNFKIGMGLLLF